MATVTGVHQVVFALREHGQDMERGVQDELARSAQRVANTMKRLANKRDDGKIPGGTGALVNSIRPVKVDDSTWDIGPNPDFVGTNGERPFTYASYVEDGVKPGGKGLPRFFDPAAKSVVDWLQRTAFGGQHKGGMGTRALQSQETELRDRYGGLAWHVRHFGVKAHPFVKPTADEMEPVVLKRLDLAVRRVLAARGGSGVVTA
jgi:hypothetical protein